MDENEGKKLCMEEFRYAFFDKSRFHLDKLENIRLIGNVCDSKLKKGKTLEFGRNENIIVFELYNGYMGTALSIHIKPVPTLPKEPSITKLLIRNLDSEI